MTVGYILYRNDLDNSKPLSKTDIKQPGTGLLLSNAWNTIANPGDATRPATLVDCIYQGTEPVQIFYELRQNINCCPDA